MLVGCVLTTISVLKLRFLCNYRIPFGLVVIYLISVLLPKILTFQWIFIDWSLWCRKEWCTKGYWSFVKRFLNHVICNIKSVFGHALDLEVPSFPVKSARLSNWFIILIWAFLVIQKLSETTGFLYYFSSLLFGLSLAKFIEIEVFICTDWRGCLNISLVEFEVWIWPYIFGSLLDLKKIGMTMIIVFDKRGFWLFYWEIDDVIFLSWFVISIWIFLIVAKIRLFVVTVYIWKDYWLLSPSLHLPQTVVVSKDSLDCFLEILILLAKANEFLSLYFRRCGDDGICL